MCSAGSRAIVQEGVAAQLIKKIKERMGRLRVGDSLDKCIDMGPIVDGSQVKSIDHFVQQARQEGAEVMRGWGCPCSDVIVSLKVFQSSACIPTGGKGYFYPPTLITNVQPVSTCVQEEVCIIKMCCFWQLFFTDIWSSSYSVDIPYSQGSYSSS